MAWEVEYTDEFQEWWATLTVGEQDSVASAVEALERDGPNLARPFADRIQTSRHQNMKELRPPGGSIRILFAFDPRRIAILLLGGDKTGRWQDWYREMIPAADRLFDEHLGEIEREGS